MKSYIVWPLSKSTRVSKCVCVCACAKQHSSGPHRSYWGTQCLREMARRLETCSVLEFSYSTFSIVCRRTRPTTLLLLCPEVGHLMLTARLMSFPNGRFTPMLLRAIRVYLLRQLSACFQIISASICALVALKLTDMEMTDQTARLHEKAGMK